MNTVRVPRPSNPDLVVRRLGLADADEWAQYAVLAQMTRFTSSTVESVDDLIPMIDRTLAGDPSSPVLFAVRSRTTGELLATVGFHSVMPHYRTAEITYDVRPKHWGKGIASACCLAAVEWGFTVREWVRIQGTAQEQNLASQAVLRKCGFAYEGRLRNLRIVRGVPCDYLVYSAIPGDRPANAP